MFDCSNFFLQGMSLELPASIDLPAVREVQHFDFILGDQIFMHNDISSFDFVSNLIFRDHALNNLCLTDRSLFVDHDVSARNLSRTHQDHNPVLFVDHVVISRSFNRFDHCDVFVLDCGSFVLNSELIFSFDPGGLNSCFEHDSELRRWFHCSCLNWKVFRDFRLKHLRYVRVL